MLATTYLQSAQGTSKPSVLTVVKAIQPATEDVIFTRSFKKKVSEALTAALHSSK